MSTKPWEGTWTWDCVAGDANVRNDGERFLVGEGPTDDDVARVAMAAAAPDMARALNAVVAGVLASITPVFGPMPIDEVVERGQPVAITAKELGSIVAALRKAGVL